MIRFDSVFNLVRDNFLDALDRIDVSINEDYMKIGGVEYVKPLSVDDRAPVIHMCAAILNLEEIGHEIRITKLSKNARTFYQDFVHYLNGIGHNIWVIDYDDSITIKLRKERTFMKIKSIKKVGEDHTWDVSVPNGEQYVLLNGVVSHNTSSQLANETNGIEPPKALISIKASKDGVMPQVVPNYASLKNEYVKAWDVPVRDYLYTVSVLQQFIDQAISANTTYNPHEEEITSSKLINDLIYSWKLGV